MNPSSEGLQQLPVSYDDEACNERKCANCFENGGCMYDWYMTNASIEKLESAEIHQALLHARQVRSGEY